MAESAGLRGAALSQSGDSMPAGKSSRTFEAWVDYGCCNGAFSLFQYGDLAGGNGFAVSIGDNGSSIVVTGGAATFSAGTIDDFAHGWHMVDVSYDGTDGTVEIYQDGQVIGSGQLDLGTTGTVTPGQGLELGANTAGMGLDEVAIFGVALSPEQIDSHWSAGQANLGIGPAPRRRPPRTQRRSWPIRRLCTTGSTTRRWARRTGWRSTSPLIAPMPRMRGTPRR